MSVQLDRIKKLFAFEINEKDIERIQEKVYEIKVGRNYLITKNEDEN
jgi:hypothetical protein